jgi:hypothetical protein
MKPLVLALLVVAIVPATAAAQERPPMQSCGDLEATNGALVGDITARRVSCRNARRVARRVPTRCGNESFCMVRGFSCLNARATEELRFTRCTKSRDNDELYRVIRFDWGS